MKKLLFEMLLFGVFFGVVQISLAQGITTASINGKVSAMDGEVLPAASVMAVHVPTGTVYGTSTRMDGKYNLTGLKTGGPYKITVSFVGYNTQIKENVYLELAQNLMINFKLPESSVTLNELTITAEKSAILSQARTGSSQNVSEKSMQEIPTTTRDFQSFSKLSPLFSGSGLGAAGRSSKYNNIQIDGTQYNDLFGLGNSGTPGGQSGTTPISLDAISEFQVVIAPYDVRQSGFTGGGINAITRSGTNQYHGSVYGFGRNQNMSGQFINKDGKRTKKMDEFKDYQFGFRAGGPIIQDQLFFFVNGEKTIYNYPQPNLSVGSRLAGVSIDSLGGAFATALAAKGFNAGGFNLPTFEQPSSKLFVRFDYNLAENHKLTVRNNFVDAGSDKLYNYRTTSNLLFDTQPYLMSNMTNSMVAQLNSTFGNTMSNELVVGYTTIRDKRKGKSADAPEVLIKEINKTFSMYAGPDRFSSANKLDQDIFEISDNFSLYMGDHTFTVGTHNEFFSFANLFARSAFGYYEYNSLADFAADKVSYYQRVYSRFGDQRDPSAVPAAEFSVSQFGFYAQDEWAILPTLKITAGIRVDIPTFPTTPAKNDSLPKYFSQYRTDQIPSGNMLWSPRVGFNWDVTGERTTQVRGGVGIFTGRIPYVWMSNNFGNTGMFTAEVNYGGSGTLPFNPDPRSQYISGDPGTGAAKFQSEIDVVDPNLKLPQVMRFNLGVDQELICGFIGTAEFLYSKSLNEMLYRKGNLKPSTSNLADGRPRYGGTDYGNGNFWDIMELYNTSDGYQYNLMFQLQRNVARGVSVNTAYTFGEAKDKNSLSSSQAASQMNYSPIDMDPNNPALTTSQWEVKHRAFASVSYSAEFFQNAPTTISLFYNGQSGNPFSFVVNGDLNNDGFRYNDLFYIPKDAGDILVGTISGGKFVAATKAGTTADDLNAFIQNDDYLGKNRGKISERNGAREKWQQYLDLRITQDVPDFLGMGTFQFSLDILNVANLLNTSWGRVQTAGLGTYNIVALQGLVTNNGVANTPVYSFSKPTNNSVYTDSDISSRWRMQLGVRYTL
ncbi:MAG: carboxypeptidase regulatory-like domain-containing protein [Ignavibacteriaceae bacterium]|nr:carboxypeptidase regulatory-like domain-containing protein [Ignavibacteriaceae bacterium]